MPTFDQLMNHPAPSDEQKMILAAVVLLAKAGTIEEYRHMYAQIAVQADVEVKHEG